jgi:predicted kinase
MIIALVGLPGSGKTNYLTKLCSRTEFVSVDDFNFSTNSVDNIMAILRAGQIVVIASSQLCLKERREKFKSRFESEEVQWIYFENNKERCIENLKERCPGETVFPSLEILSRVYEIPEGVDEVPI